MREISNSTLKRSCLSSKQATHLKKIIELNPNAILDVIEEKNAVLVQNYNLPEKYQALVFSDDEFLQAKKIIVNEIKSRRNTSERCEHWEAKNVHGLYDLSIEKTLIEIRSR